ncbi:LysR family transcriptional regulator [Streptomyces griseofuscus]|uniref:LysR family transcriptional regulator n=1 Tax=Streptomyces griseofuscus TaxID=146922 RepID=UPI003698008B
MAPFQTGSTAPSIPRSGRRLGDIFEVLPAAEGTSTKGGSWRRHLRYAVALAAHEHLRRSAGALGIARPPLSKQIADLEREVGARLFDRTRQGVFPTAAGEAFLARARRALDEVAAATVDAGRAARGETGRLRLGLIASALLDLLPGVLGRFGRERPDVRLELHEMATSRSGPVDTAADRVGRRGRARRGRRTAHPARHGLLGSQRRDRREGRTHDHRPRRLRCGRRPGAVPHEGGPAFGRAVL